MRILFTTHAHPRFLPPTLVDPGEIVAGPQYNKVVIGGTVRFLGTPSGRWDINPILAAIPPEQRPELLLVHADSTMGCAPVGFPQGLPRVLLVGDTHHLDRPLRKLLQYASDGQFNAVVCWNRQHAHFFRQAGFQHVFWMPGLTFGIPEVPRPANRKLCVSFFGQVGKYHPRRQRLVAALKESGVPFVSGSMPRREGLELFAGSLIALNSALNGEFNLRVFEATANGALLLTDRLSPHTGLDLFYKDGESMVCYDGPDDLVDKARHYLANPQAALEIAARGEAIYRRLFTAEARRDTFFKIVQGGQPPIEFLLRDEPRCRLAPVADAAGADLLRQRVALYEWVQEQHRQEETVAVEFAGEVPPQMIADISDLVRVQLSVTEVPGVTRNRHLLEAACTLGSRIADEPGHLGGGHLLVCDLRTLLTDAVLAAVEQQRYRALCVWDIPEPNRAACADDLAPLGYTPAEGTPTLFLRQEV